jgi:Zn-dependent protease with chaperone function
MKVLELIQEAVAGHESDSPGVEDEFLEVLNDLYEEHAVEPHAPFHERAHLLFETLLDELACEQRPNLLLVQDDSAFPAFCAPNTIVLGSSLGRLDDDELAFVIAHELGHILHEDFGRGSERGWLKGVEQMRQQEKEFAADRFARDLVIACGWPTGGVHVLRRMHGLDPRTDVRSNVYRRIPFVGNAIVRVRQAIDRWKHSHPSIEHRISALADLPPARRCPAYRPRPLRLTLETCGRCGTDSA